MRSWVRSRTWAPWWLRQRRGGGAGGAVQHVPDGAALQQQRHALLQQLIQAPLQHPALLRPRMDAAMRVGTRSYCGRVRNWEVLWDVSANFSSCILSTSFLDDLSYTVVTVQSRPKVRGPHVGCKIILNRVFNPLASDFDPNLHIISIDCYFFLLLMILLLLQTFIVTNKTK